jgi:hypothetical protein
LVQFRNPKVFFVSSRTLLIWLQATISPGAVGIDSQQIAGTIPGDNSPDIRVAHLTAEGEDGFWDNYTIK